MQLKFIIACCWLFSLQMQLWKSVAIPPIKIHTTVTSQKYSWWTRTYIHRVPPPPNKEMDAFSHHFSLLLIVGHGHDDIGYIHRFLDLWNHLNVVVVFHFDLGNDSDWSDFSTLRAWHDFALWHPMTIGYQRVNHHLKCWWKLSKTRQFQYVGWSSCIDGKILAM